MTEHDFEPVPGLPGPLPAGETILWQGRPDWRTLVDSALHGRWIALYFAVLAAWALVSGNGTGALLTLAAGGAALGLVGAFAAAVSRSTIYTLTNRRVVLRIGVAVSKCINLPLPTIAAADLRQLSGRCGDIALRLSGPHRLGYAMLWPHARPWRIGAPQPMLRAVPDAHAVAGLLGQACAARTQPGAPLRLAEASSLPIGELAGSAA